ncbi:MAG: radical SAM family heme chaperone HemW [Alphaproteobacteria bacterium]|nr:radical SAM family heme chaperone HemW [Alphaproteobacteria bacterium]
MMKLLDMFQKLCNNRMTVSPHNIYIHVPFCVKKCNYCAFYSKVCGAPDWLDYKNQILSEINFWVGKIGRAAVPTIFFGGGTPSLMPTKIFAEIMNAIRSAFDVAPDTEITIEANPGTIDTQRLQEFIAAGVNRISIGVQSLNDEELKFLGRIHNATDARKFIADAQNAGIRVSADFIYGLPDQTVADVKKLCQQINELGLEHCSMYELSIESGTALAKQNLKMPDNETMAQMYEAVGETLNLQRYEVSNYGTPCQHNANVWDGQPYLGLGDGAAGRVFINNQWYETKYDSIGVLREAPLQNRERALEVLLTGLRTTQGVKLTPEIKEITNWNSAELTIKDNRLVAKNFLLLDNLIVRLLK